MSAVYIAGIGSVTPAGWGMEAMRSAIQENRSPDPIQLPRPGKAPDLIRKVPAPPVRFPFLAHPRLRRSSPIAQFSIAAALEALGEDLQPVKEGKLKLGVILASMSGCVNYSRRFYDETLKDPATASPLVFPETVFNAPASHIAAFLPTQAINYTLIGDPGTYLQGLALAAQWLDAEKVDGCLVVGSEEGDWLTTMAFRLFFRNLVLSDGAGALYLKRTPNPRFPVRLEAITDSFLITKKKSRSEAAAQMRSQLAGFSSPGSQVFDGLQGIPKLDRDEEQVFSDWTGSRCSVKRVLGEGLMAAASWQCIAAVDSLLKKNTKQATVPIVGFNQQAIGAVFTSTAEN